MRILAVSDIEEKVLWDRFDPAKWRGVDLVVSCGDLKSAYLEFLVTMLRLPLIYVRGNHDVSYAKEPPGGCDDIDRRIVTYAGVRFLGLEGCMWYNGQPYQYTEAQMRMRALKLWPALAVPGRVDVLVTHAPPRGVHDAQDVCHTGFKVFGSMLRASKPKLMIHGHTHLGYYQKRERETLVGSTRVVDAYGHCVLDIEPRR